MPDPSTRERLLDAAWREVTDHGVDGLTLASVGARAGVTRQAVYLHFGNRATLLVEMTARFDRTSGFRRTLAATRHLPPRDGLRRMLDLWFDYLPSILRVGLALEGASLTGGDGADAYRDRMRDWRDGIRVAIARLADDDQLSLAWDVDTATDWTWASVHPTNVHHLTGERGWTRTDTARRIIESLERELLRPPRPGSFGPGSFGPGSFVAAVRDPGAGRLTGWSLVAEGPVVAAFDVDGTLTRRDCVVPFLLRLGAGRLVFGLARRAPSVIVALARRDRQRLKVLATAFAVRGRAVADVERVAAAFGTEIEQWLRDDTVARLNWHRQEGHTVVLVSASYELYLDGLGQALGVDAVLATRLATVSEVDAVGATYTGALIGDNCRGPEKLRRLDEWLATRDDIEGGRRGIVLWAYGDSAGDRELLGAADHPVWVTSPLTSVPSTD